MPRSAASSRSPSPACTPSSPNRTDSQALRVGPPRSAAAQGVEGHEAVARRAQSRDDPWQGVGVERAVVGRVGPDMHEHDLARCGCPEDALDYGVDAATTRGPLPAEAVDGPADGDVPEVVDQVQLARARVAEGEAEERARILACDAHDRRPRAVDLGPDLC